MLLSKNAFSNKIVQDFREEFLSVEVKDNLICINNESNFAHVPIDMIFDEYLILKDYDEMYATYSKIIKEILEQHKYKVDYNNIYPIIKNNNFGTGNRDLEYYKENVFEDLSTFYVSDLGEVFRFILKTDEVEDYEMLRIKAWENLERLTNALVKMDEALDIYTLNFNTDYNATLILSKVFQKQIVRRVGTDYLFIVPSSTTLIIAKYRFEYIRILDALAQIDNGPNKVSNKVYRCTGGKYEIVSEQGIKENNR